MNLLIVCGVNFSRSQALAHHIQELARERSLDIKVKTAGVHAEIIKELRGYGVRNQETSERMIEAADVFEKGISRRDKTRTFAKPVTKALISWADRVFAADAKTRARLLKKFPGNAKKIKVAKEVATGKKLSRKSGDFKDPFAEKTAKKYRRGAMQATLEKPSPRAFWLMNHEAQRMARRLVRKMRVRRI